MPYVIVILDRDRELVPGLTKAQLRAIAERSSTNTTATVFDATQAEAGIAVREERKAAARTS